MSDKLMSRDQVKTYILANKGRFACEDAVNFARQLYNVMGELSDTMRENLALRKLMLEVHKLIKEGEIFEATAILKIEGEQRYKESEENK